MVSRSLKLVACVIGIILLMLFMAYFPFPKYTYYMDVAFDTGHIVVFGFVNIFLLIGIKACIPGVRPRRQYGWAAATSMAIGILVEIVQTFSYRSAEIVDVVNDLVGVVAASCCCAAFDRRLTDNAIRRFDLLLVAIVWLAAGCLPLWQTYQQYQHRRDIIPALMDWEVLWFERLYYFSRSNYEAFPRPVSWPESDPRLKYVARVESHPGTSPGFVFLDPYPDWTGYSKLEIEMRLDDSAARSFVLRVHDQLHDDTFDDRFNRTILVKPGFQTIRVDLQDVRMGPKHRELNLDSVDGMGLFIPNLDSIVVYCIGDIRLVK